MEQVLRYNIGR